MAPLVERLQADLVVAMKSRDAARVTVLRTALAAIANAEALPIDSAPTYSKPGTTEHRRVELTASDVDRIIRREIAERLDSIVDYEGVGVLEPASALRAEVAVLEGYLG